MKNCYRLLLIIALGFAPLFLHAAYFRFLPQTITQPDGTVINCFASGDEFFNWYHDANGYTIIQGKDGYFYYGEKDGDDVKPSAYRVNSVDPGTVGLQKWAIISPAKIKEKRNVFYSLPKKSSKSPHTGTYNNICIYIRFSDQTEFTTHRSVFDSKFSSTTSNSLKKYYLEASYNNLTINTTHYPVCTPDTNLSYVDSHPRAYYLPYDVNNNPIGYQSDRTDREHTLLANAVNAISSQVPVGLNIDGDNDGFVDNICFIIRGGNSAWADLLWAHRWWLSTQTVYINGKQVSDYTFQPESQNDVVTLCHEMFHSLGAPDLYHYSYDGLSPVGDWDIMESGSGHMGAFMKWKYAGNAWITTIPEITTSGTYTLHPLTSATNNCYKIASPVSADEFFVVEYRKKIAGTFENNVPGSGLLVYRIHEDPTDVGDGNADGPPDEVYIYRPDGTLSTNGICATANFSSNTGRTAINNFSNPGAFLSDGTNGELNLYNVTAADSTISFDIGFNSAPVADFSASRVAVIQGESIDFTDNSIGNPTSWIWYFPGSNIPTTTIHDPTGITYSTPGSYTVTLKATNSHGSDTTIKTAYIHVVTNILDCSGAINLSCGVPYDGNTATNGIYNVDQYNCTNNNFYGPEIIHTITTTGTTNLKATLSNYGTQLLYVIFADSCASSHCIDYNHSAVIYNNAAPDTYYLIVDGYKGALGPYRLNVTCTPSAGIHENTEASDVSIFPNPGSGNFNVVFNTMVAENYTVSVFNLFGQIISEEKKEFHQGENTFSLHMSNQAQGLYYLQLRSSDNEFVKKLIVQ
jgi:M6 family metalloprotease-like protein